MGTVSIVEIIWITVVALGVIFHIWALIDALLDYGAVQMLEHIRTNGVGEEHVYASYKSVQAETLRLFVQLTFLFVGIVAMLTPPAIDDPSLGSSIWRSIPATGITFAAIILVANSVLDRRARTVLTRMIRRKTERKESVNEPRARPD